MVLPARTVAQGNPPASSHQIDQEQLGDWMEGIENTKSDQTDLDALDARVTANESAVSGNGIDRDPVAAWAGSNITLSGSQTVDGVTLSNGDRVGVGGQTAPEENGVYTYNDAGAWTRVTDMDTSSEINLSTVFVDGGTTYGARSYRFSVADPDTFVLDTDAITATQVGDAGALQDQIDLKAPAADPAFTGDVDMSAADSVTVPTGTADMHAVNKAQMDTAVAGATIAGIDTDGLYGDESLPDGYEFAILDSDNAVALGITPDGTLRTKQSQTDTHIIGTDEISVDGSQGWGQSTTDDTGNVGSGVSHSGRLAARDPVFKGTGARALKSGRRFPGDLIYINSTGQSNAAGTTTASGNTSETTTRERGALGVKSTGKDGLYELTNAHFNQTDRGENPTFGTIGFILELCEKENGLDWQRHDVRFAGSNNGTAGTSLAELSDGGSTGQFENAIAQAEMIAGAASNAGLAPSFGATTWAQGEAEPGSATYKADLIALAEDYRAQGKAATGQGHDPLFITWQLSLNTTASAGVSQAQLEASNERPGLIRCSGPTYHLPRLDGTHFTGLGYKWLGAMFGNVYKRVVIDDMDWRPLQPVYHTVLGNTVTLAFNKGGLVFDTTGDLPAQTNYGFTATEDDNSTPITISSVEIVGDNRVRITLASAPASGYRIKYGHQNMSGITAWTYTGPGGNLRDSAGDDLTYDAISKPMHNWCCIFNYEV